MIHYDKTAPQPTTEATIQTVMMLNDVCDLQSWIDMFISMCFAVRMYAEIVENFAQCETCYNLLNMDMYEYGSFRIDR